MTASMTDVRRTGNVAGESVATMIQRLQKVFTRIERAIISQHATRKTPVSSDSKMYGCLYRQGRDKQITPDRYLYMIGKITQPESSSPHNKIAQYHQTALSQKYYVGH